MSETIEEILAKCVERMEAGASMESCLADYPKVAAELEPLLQMAQQIKVLTKVNPRLDFAHNARLHLESQLTTPGKAVTFKGFIRRTRQEPKPLVQRRFSMSLLQLIVTSVLVLTATTGGVAYAANASNPGDYLHGLDLAMENAQLNLTSGVSNKVQLRLQFASERLAEAQATFSKNDVTDGLEAINEYDAEISATAQLVGSANGADPEALATLLETAQGVHQDVLKKLLDEVPDQAKDAIQKALDVSNNPGKPDGTSNPNSSNPNGVGNPNTIGTPGADISACAKSLSQQDAQTLANLAKKYGVDYQYVLENFCALGTLEKVQKMLSTLQGPPTTIPNGSPASSSANPPVNPPGRP